MLQTAPLTRTATEDAPAPAPLWVNLLDGLIAVLLLLSVCVWLFGGHREMVAGVRISLRSWPRLLLAAALLTLLRRALFRRIPLSSRLRQAVRQARGSAALHAAWMPFIATRPAVLAAGYFAVVTFGFIPSMVRFRISNNELVNLAARWDAQWYLKIAQEGYSWNGNPEIMQSVVFFPVLPISMHVGAFFAGGQLVNGGLMIALASFLGALTYLYKFSEPLMGARAAQATAWLLAAYPFAVYYGAPYTESIYLLGSVAMFYHLSRDEWRAAAAWGLLMGVARPNGFILAAPIGLLVLQRAYARRAFSVGELAAAAAPVVGLLLFAGFLYLRVGDPLVWMKGQAAWGRGYGGAAQTIDAVSERAVNVFRWGLYRYSVTEPFVFLHTAAVLVALASIVPTLRRFGAPLAIFTAANLLPALLSGGTMSAGRMTSVLFPMFMWAGAAIPGKYIPAIVAGSCVLQGLIAALFFTWRAIF